MKNQDEITIRNERSRRLKSLRNMTRLSRRAFSERYGIPAATLKNWEDAKYGGLTEKGSRKVLKALKGEGIYCSLEWLLHGIGTSPQISDKLYTEGFGLKQMASQDSADENAVITAELQLIYQHYKDVIDFIVEDDAMEPRFIKGEHVAGKKRYRDTIRSILGQDCIVQTGDGQVLLRQVRQGSMPSVYTLRSINTHTKLDKPILYDVELLSAAPVIWSRRKDATFIGKPTTTKKTAELAEA